MSFIIYRKIIVRSGDLNCYKKLCFVIAYDFRTFFMIRTEYTLNTYIICT